MRRRRILRGLIAATTVGLAGCSGDDGGDGEDPDADGGGGADEDGGTDAGEDGPTEEALSITSPAFDDGEAIPQKYTDDGEDISPPLSVDEVPEAAGGLALIVEDPDAPDPPFTHWLLWNLPADTTEIPEDQPREETLPDLGGARQGTNDFDDLGYRGPAPPSDDDPHRYRFEAVALETPLEIDSGARRETVESAVEGRRIESAELAGTYGR